MSNFSFWFESGYFDIECARKPLLHLWSLGIEEQFYMSWPLLLMLAARFRMSILAMAALLGIASFMLNVALIGSNPIAAFYLPFTRAFELLTGAVLACGWITVNQSSAASNWRAWIGVALIAVAAALLDSHRAFPGWWAVLPVAGSALLLSTPAAWVNRVVLSSKPLVWIGLISYPLYLWHWPLLVFFGIIKFGPLALLERELIRVFASMVLAWASTEPRRDAVPLRHPEPAQDVQPRRRHGDGRGRRHGRHLGARLDFRLPPEIRAMASVRRKASSGGFMNACSISARKQILPTVASSAIGARWS